MCTHLKNLGFGPLPILIALIFFIQSFIVYAIALLKHDVDPIFPYLSSAADKRPESCIFAIGANISSLLLAILVFVRYQQLLGIFSSESDIPQRVFNNRTRWFGYISALGMFIVANVQETAIIPVHMSAAFMTFGGFCLYMICQCYLTFKVTPHVTKWSVFYYRLAFTILSCFSLLFAIVFGVTAAHIYHQTYPDLPTPRPWSRRFYQPGYEFHQISAISEWTCAIFQIFFMQSFGPEFEEISVQFFLQSKYNSAESGISDSERDELETQHII